MARFVRNTELRDGAKITPGNLTALVGSASVEDIALSDLDSSLRQLYHGPTAPSLTMGTIWYDTTSGQEGLKYAWLTPSSGSLSGFLYATPRREAFYWAATTVSVGAPCFLYRDGAAEAGVHLHEYDGTFLPILHQYFAASTQPAPTVVIPMESRVGAGPVKAAWAGLVPAWTNASRVTAGDILYINLADPSPWRTERVPDSLLTSLAAYWKFDEDPTDGTPSEVNAASNYLFDAGNPVNVAGQVSNAAQLGSIQWFSHSSASFANWSTKQAFTFSGWFKLRSDLNSVVVANWNAASKKQVLLLYNNVTKTFTFGVSPDGTAATTIDYSDYNTMSPAPTGVYYHFACGYDADNDQIFLQLDNGTKDTAAFSSALGGQGPGFNIGLAIAGGGSTLTSAIDVDEIGLWERTLTSDEITRLWNSGNGTTYPFGAAPVVSAQALPFGVALANDSALDGTPFILWGNGAALQDIVP